MFFLLYRHTWRRFRRFSEDFRPLSEGFRGVSKNCSEGQTKVPEHFPKISEDCRRLSRKTRRCFDHTHEFQYNLLETNLTSVKSLISSLVRIWRICHSSPGCSFIWILWVVHFPVKHLCCLYNNMEVQCSYAAWNPTSITYLSRPSSQKL